MCGICGFVGRPSGPLDLAAGRAMANVLRHRGPDGEGELEIRCGGTGRELHGWLGHRRLKILDLSEAADQPMLSDDGRLALTYNGEVYNFRELRRELEADGHSFRSTGDTEVVLRAYEQWGEEFLHRIDGMFALALWDGRLGRLLLARDRAGKKPLFYTELGGRLSFASEIKALLAAPWVDPRPEFSRVPELLTYGYVPQPATMYEGIAQLPPASAVTYDAGGLSLPKPYWDWQGPVAAATAPGGAEVSREVVALLERAVERRMVSDVPLGAFLSGGIDSSIVVGLMSKLSVEPVHTFSIGFPDEPSYDERPHARRVAEHFATSHTEFAVKADAVALMETLLWHHDQPFADSSAIPTYLVSQLAREHVTVVLNGDGGDEVFGGYERFAAAAISDLVPLWAARGARRMAGALPVDHGYYSKRRRAERFLELAELPVRDRYQAWIAVLSDDLLHELLAPDLRGRLEPGALTASMDDCYERAAGQSTLDQIMYANFKTYLPDDLAVKIDRMSMAHSLEARSPFLDTALVDYLSRLPAKRKVGLRRLKPLLRNAFWPLLPEEIWKRRKHGFGVPVGHWFRGELGTMFEDETLSSDARIRAVLDQSALLRLWREHTAGEREHGARLWTILTLEHWLRGQERPHPTRPPVSPAARALSA